MCALAESFVETSIGSGWAMGWGPSFVRVLDRFIDSLGPEDSPVWFVGAYLGELIVRQGGGSWSLPADGKWPVVETTTGSIVDAVAAANAVLHDVAAPPMSTVYVYAVVGQAPPINGQSDFGTDLGERMRTWAGVFMHTASLDGWHVDWSAGSLDTVETMCDELVGSAHDTDVIEDLTWTMGAYVGELIRTAVSGTWMLDTTHNALAVDVPGRLRCFPMEKVSRRLSEGAGHDLRGYYARAMALTKCSGIGDRLHTM